jgi:lysine N6-hydroxylase
MTPHFNLLGIGIGPFNLSLAALLTKAPRLSSLFFEQKSGFEWHSELMLPDSVMQTSYLKDLVTPADPTSPFSFLNYLVEEGLFYSFLHSDRRVVTRREFELYCQWVSRRLGDRLRFDEGVSAVDFREGRFHLATAKGAYTSDHLCVATGHAPSLPACVEGLLGPDLFHAKSPYLRDLTLAGKRLVVVGGGQTGLEIFRNALGDRWGRAESVRLITARRSLEPLDESAFTNEYFTPGYVDDFWAFPESRKAELLEHQKLTSDGNTPAYLTDLYRDLYLRRHVEGDARAMDIFAGRTLEEARREGGGWRLKIVNELTGKAEELGADVVVLATGFRATIPKALEPLRARLFLDDQGRFRMGRDFTAAWEGEASNRIYAFNFSRHQHGISEPQTSLMAWRSATVVNHLAGEKIFLRRPSVPGFVKFQ